MKNKIIAAFKEPVILDSIRTQFMQFEFEESLFNYVTFRLLKNNRETEYRFRYVLEYTQQKRDIPNGLYIQTDSDWCKEYKKNNPKGTQETTVPDGSRKIDQLDAKHFIIAIDKHCFHILAESYLIDERRFFETYRGDSEKIRKIVS